MKNSFFLFVGLLFSTLLNADPKTPFQSIEELYLEGRTVKSFQGTYKNRIWGGYCSRAAVPNSLEQSVFGKNDLSDPVLGKREYLTVLFGKSYLQIDSFAIQREIDSIIKNNKLSGEYSPLYFDKTEDAIAIRQYRRPTNPNLPSVDPLYIYFFRENYTKNNEKFYTMKMFDFQSNEIIKLCYFYKDLSYGL